MYSHTTAQDRINVHVLENGFLKLINSESTEYGIRMKVFQGNQWRGGGQAAVPLAFTSLQWKIKSI